MSTIDSHGNHHHRSGTPGAGQFASKGNSAPSGGLSDFDPAQVDPPDVRTPEFTIESLRAAVGVEDLIDFELDEQGRTRVGWSKASYGTEWLNRATIDDQGDIVALETKWQGGNWGAADADGQELHHLRHKVNVDRLAFAGIFTHGVQNDGGAYGNRFVGGRAHEDLYDASEISKRIRADLKKAQEVGAIPSHLTYRVHTDKFAGGQSITVSCEGIKDSQLCMDRGDGFNGRHPWAYELDKTISVIGDQWQDSEIESQTDYFNVRYYFHVEMPDERMQEWRDQERQKAALKRAARSANAQSTQ